MESEEAKRASIQRTEIFRRSIPSGQYLSIPLNGVDYIEELSLSRSVVKNWRSHPYQYVVEKNHSITDLQCLFKNAVFYGWAKDDVLILPNGSHIKKHPGVLLWLYYEVLVLDEVSYVCVQVKDDGKRIPYCILDQNSWQKLKPRVSIERPLL